MIKRGQTLGFTIVELLIVIVVIAVIAALVLNAFSGAQDKAKAAGIVSGMKMTEKAFRSYGIVSGITTWWDDNSNPALVAGSSNPLISAIITNQAEFRRYLADTPTANVAGTSWIYDNDSDTYSGCAANSSGVNLVIQSLNNQNLAQLVDNTMDDGNLSCGRIRYYLSSGNMNLGYSLSATQPFQ